MKKLLILVAILSQNLMALDVEAGKEKFNSTCVVCHGSNGERKALGISQIISDIGDAEVIEGLLKNIRDKGKESGKNMAMVNTASGLSDEDIENLSAYISTLATLKK
ncbi:MAG TPA: c-type cytochrome [Bacteroidetes bacterium]|nr:c-type cytochrome [Bacteroidota bacterium]